MTIDLDPAWMMAVFFTALRLGVVLMMTPIFSNLSGLVTVRVLLTLSLSALLVSGLGARLPPPALELGPVLLAETGLAVVSRVLPQMNVFVVGVPVKIVVGLAVFALTMGTLQPVMARVYASIFIYWEQVLS